MADEEVMWPPDGDLKQPANWIELESIPPADATIALGQFVFGFESAEAMPLNPDMPERNRAKLAVARGLTEALWGGAKAGEALLPLRRKPHPTVREALGVISYLRNRAAQPAVILPPSDGVAGTYLRVEVAVELSTFRYAIAEYSATADRPTIFPTRDQPSLSFRREITPGGNGRLQNEFAVRLPLGKLTYFASVSAGSHGTIVGPRPDATFEWNAQTQLSGAIGRQHSNMLLILKSPHVLPNRADALGLVRGSVPRSLSGNLSTAS